MMGSHAHAHADLPKSRAGERTARERRGGAGALAAEHGAEVVELPHNPGYGGAINAAVSRLPESVEWLVISNPDVVLRPGAIDALVAVGEQDPRIGAVGPAVENLDGTVYRGDRPVEGAVEALEGARERGVAIAYVTNNASRGPQDVADHLARLGLTVGADDVVTSAQAGAASGVRPSRSRTAAAAARAEAAP